MRAVDRLSTVVAAVAFVLAGLGAPACTENHQPGAAVTAVQRSIDHGGHAVLPPDGRAAVDTPVPTPGRAAPPSGDPRAAAAPRAPGDAPSELRTEFSGGPCGDHRAGVTAGDGPDDVLPAAYQQVGGRPEWVAAAIARPQPALPLPPRGTLATRGPPASA
ncbi:hypothetical protein RMN56_15960 [Micromonospora halotolerans]|uniref:Uncharacterized protein n=1 Tax=Micromonospora halotolerans TaxID=709879 RepID=A0ABZ0A7P3_9ACTN|nr:hypothetical protein [Micromonospora halotolerans]WNM42741.1 hypothetical protein RMN56_15960 [Micromonospora halotolerans]